MVLHDFLICLSIMPSLKAQLFLVKKLSCNNCGVILHEFNIIKNKLAVAITRVPGYQVACKFGYHGNV